jgi:hypothetical protein
LGLYVWGVGVWEAVRHGGSNKGPRPCSRVDQSARHVGLCETLLKEARPPRRPRMPDTFDWGIGDRRFAFTRRQGVAAGWQARCLVHPSEKGHGSSGILLACTREISIRALRSSIPEIAPDDAEEVLLRTLKFWCVSGVVASHRREHMNPTLFPRVSPLVELPSDADLNLRLSQLIQ